MSHLLNQLIRVQEGGKTGYRLKGFISANYGDIGASAVDFSQSTSASSTRGATGTLSKAWGRNVIASGSMSTAFGLGNTASGVYSTAWGNGNTASYSCATAWGTGTSANNLYATAWGYGTSANGAYSTAWGKGTTAADSYSTAFGYNSSAEGDASIAWGYSCNTYAADSMAGGRNTVALGNQSVALGDGNTASAKGSVVIGHFATEASGQNYTGITATNEVFKIGKGTSSGARSNALIVYKNSVQLWGGITATAASALTPAAGMIAYVTDTNGTFTSVGFWAYEGGAWTKL